MHSRILASVGALSLALNGAPARAYNEPPVGPATLTSLTIKGCIGVAYGNDTLPVTCSTTIPLGSVSGLISGLAGKAANGANSDITSLNGLTTPLSVGQGGLGNGTGDASALTVAPFGAAGYAGAMSQLAQTSGVLLDTFKLSGDADDTAAFNRAVSAGVPILLGPKTYLVHDFSTGTPSTFILRGIPGVSAVQRISASGGSFFSANAANVYIDGVIFDANKANVTANQWGVLANAGGQNIAIRNSKFINNSGTLGSCLAILGTGPAAGGFFNLDNIEVSGCAGNAVHLGSVAHGVLIAPYVHDNASVGIFAGVYGTVSSTNYLTDVSIVAPHVYRNGGTGLSVGGYGPPYSFATIPASFVSATGGIFEDNATYGASYEGFDLIFSNNIIRKSSSGVTCFGGFDALSTRITVNDNVVNLPGSSWGIDVGGSVDVVAHHNTVTSNAGVALNVGGNQNGDFTDNHLIISSTAGAINEYAVEGDGSGNVFPTVASGTKIERNTIDMIGSSAVGMRLLDNPGGMVGALATVLRNNHFNLSGGAYYSSAITWYGSPSSLLISGNDVNGAQIEFVDPNGNGDVVFDLYLLGGGVVQGISSTANVRSVQTELITSNGSGGSILYVSPSAGGANYTAATVLHANGTGGGSGWTGTAQIVNGVIIGVKTTAFGSGYSGTVTVSATDAGGGSGATFTVGNIPALPNLASLTYVSASNHLLQSGGAYISLTPGVPIQMSAGSSVLLTSIFDGNYWRPSAIITASYASASLPTCNSTASGAQIGVTGSSSGKWSARCNGINWIYPDGTTAP